MNLLAVFLDACFFIAIYNEADIHHNRALELAKELDNGRYGELITSDDVFDEAISVTLRKFGKEKAQQLGIQILKSVFIVNGNKHIFNASFRLFSSSKEPFSFTDCSAQAIMELADIRNIATFDKLFNVLDFEIVR